MYVDEYICEEKQLTLLARIGLTFRSNIDFMIDKIENIMDNIGMDGKQAGRSEKHLFS